MNIINPSHFNTGSFFRGASPYVGLHLFRRAVVLALTLLLQPGLIVTGHASPLAEQQDADVGKPVQSGELLPLEPEELIEREIAVETQSYRIHLQAGQAVRVLVDRHSMAMMVEALGPDGKKLNQAGPHTALEPMVMPIVILANMTGHYRVNVRAYLPGSYSIRVTTPRAPSESDLKHLTAQQLIMEALSSRGSAEADQEYLAKFEKALSIFSSMGDTYWEAWCLRTIGSFYRSTGQFQNAIGHFAKAAELWGSLGHRIMEAVTLGEIGGIYSSRLGDYQSALQYHSQELAIFRSTDERVRAEMTRIADAKALFNPASPLNSIGIIYHLLGDEQKALDYYEQAVAQMRRDPPGRGQEMDIGITLSNIGNLYRGVGASEKVLDYFGPRTDADRQKALAYYYQSLETFRGLKKIPNFRGVDNWEAFVLLQIGNTYKELGDYKKALDYLNQSHALYRAIRREGFVLKNIGSLYTQMGEYQKASEYFERALALLRVGEGRPNEPDFMNEIGSAYYAAGQGRKALELHKEALTLSRTRGQQGVAAAALYQMARVERDGGNFNDARAHIEEAIQISESIRAKLAGDAVRASYFGTVKRYYDFYTDLLMQAHKQRPSEGFDILALQTSERARSRSLLDLLSEARADIRRGVAPALLERERSLRQQLNFKAAQQNHVLLGKHTKEQAEGLSKEIAGLTAEYEGVQAQIRGASPRYAALMQPSPLGLGAIQQVLDTGTILMEYSLGDERSYLWIVTKSSISSYELPKRTEVEASARRVYGMLSARGLRLKGETEEQRRARIVRAEAEYPASSLGLSEMLLGPVASEIGTKRLLIVADGALHFVPFAALPIPKGLKGPGADLRSLGTEHEILNLPSAAVLALLRKDSAGRQRAPKTLAVLADPVFDKADARLAMTSMTRTQARLQTSSLRTAATIPSPQSSAINRTLDVTRSAGESGLAEGGGMSIPRLSFSRREADAIFNVAPAVSGLKLVDFKARKEIAVSGELSQYKIIHFATHGLLNSLHPELSGLVLSLVDERGQPQDGFLRLNDIYNLNLSADLIVLSACNTGLGREIKGEGLVGLTRGFMYAGSPRVVASLWKVDDAATAELMGLFYAKMLSKGMRPAAALRAAQLEMAKQKRWQSPYYWAAFVLQGEWK